MGHSRTPTQNTAGDGFPADPIDGYVRLRTPVIGLEGDAEYQLRVGFRS
jgi:hypothetical protein